MSACGQESAPKGSGTFAVAKPATTSNVTSSPSSPTSSSSSVEAAAAAAASDPVSWTGGHLSPSSAAQHPAASRWTETTDSSSRGGSTFSAAAASTGIFITPRAPSSSASSYHHVPRVFPYDTLSPFALSMHHPMLHHDRASQFSLASPSSASFFSHLPRPHTATYSPAAMNVVQRPYHLPLSESYAQNLIQIGHLPHLIRPSMQYPAYLNPLTIGRGGDVSGGGAVANRGLLPLAQMLPMAHRRLSSTDPFQRSPRPDSRTSWPNRLQRNSPMHQPYKEHRSPNGGGGGGGHSPVQPGRCTGGQWAGAPPPPPSHLASPKQSAGLTRKSPLSEDQGGALSSRGGPLKEHGDWSHGVTECKPLAAAKQLIAGEMASPARCSAQLRSYLHLPSSSTMGGSHSTSDPVTSSSSASAAADVAAGASTPVVPLQDQPHYPPHFMRGSIIQLGLGQLKPVEDLQTKDFVDSADNNADLQIDSSTVVHMRHNHERNTVILGFAVGKQNIQVTVEATLEHPFFVYNQGWSSYCPERTLVRYGLHCRQLMVGNSCISLTHRDPRLLPGPHAATASTARVNPTKPEPGEILPPRSETSTTGVATSYEPCRKIPRRESVVKAYFAQPVDPVSSTGWLHGPKDPDQSSSFGKSSQSVSALTARSTPTMPVATTPVGGDVSDGGGGASGMSPSTCGKRRRWSASDVKVDCDAEESVADEKGLVAVKSPPEAVTGSCTADEAMGGGGGGVLVKMATTLIDG